MKAAKFQMRPPKPVPCPQGGGRLDGSRITGTYMEGGSLENS